MAGSFRHKLRCHLPMSNVIHYVLSYFSNRKTQKQITDANIFWEEFRIPINDQILVIVLAKITHSVSWFNKWLRQWSQWYKFVVTHTRHRMTSIDVIMFGFGSRNENVQSSIVCIGVRFIRHTLRETQPPSVPQTLLLWVLMCFVIFTHNICRHDLRLVTSALCVKYANAANREIVHSNTFQADSICFFRMLETIGVIDLLHFKWKQINKKLSEMRIGDWETRRQTGSTDKCVELFLFSCKCHLKSIT